MKQGHAICHVPPAREQPPNKRCCFPGSRTYPQLKLHSHACPKDYKLLEDRKHFISLLFYMYFNTILLI